MARPKKVTEEKIITKEEEKGKHDIVDTRNALINGLKPLLLTKREMWRGGREVRSRHSKEMAYQPIIEEINKLGAQVDEAPIQLGQLRRE